MTNVAELQPVEAKLLQYEIEDLNNILFTVGNSANINCRTAHCKYYCYKFEILNANNFESSGWNWTKFVMDVLFRQLQQFHGITSKIWKFCIVLYFNFVLLNFKICSSNSFAFTGWRWAKFGDHRFFASLPFFQNSYLNFNFPNVCIDEHCPYSLRIGLSFTAAKNTNDCPNLRRGWWCPVPTRRRWRPHRRLANRSRRVTECVSFCPKYSRNTRKFD